MHSQTKGLGYFDFYQRSKTGVNPSSPAIYIPEKKLYQVDAKSADSD